ncbi:hypothetical protein GCM10009821_03990 [Aeromicrobium halocynthiae]|uniref:Uncharacterized protein n=1 Tax=Aeromicrobium halocynthiae TaxID=560557 RepID=A0ABN2VRL5_9ACTN
MAEEMLRTTLAMAAPTIVPATPRVEATHADVMAAREPAATWKADRPDRRKGRLDIAPQDRSGFKVLARPLGLSARFCRRSLRD